MTDDTIAVALVSLVGTLIGTFGGIITASKLTNYRIEQLERKVDKHNNFAEKIPLIQNDIKVANHRIDDLEELCKEHFVK
jgi:ABC-type lipoprotein release transport system permease subunit|nr:MAG TPA: Lipopolysaccharide assembly protein A domain [Caudoviricetes sp.]